MERHSWKSSDAREKAFDAPRSRGASGPSPHAGVGTCLKSTKIMHFTNFSLAVHLRALNPDPPPKFPARR